MLPLSKRFRDDFHLPLMCRAIGEFDFSYQNAFFSSGVRNNFVELFWCLEGHGSTKLFEQEFPFSEGDVFWYLPYEDHYIKKISQNFRAAYINFDGPLAAANLLAFHYPRLIKTQRPFPEMIYQNLGKLIVKCDADSMRQTTTLIMQLLEIAGESREKIFHKSQVVEQFVDIIRKNFSDSSLNINTIAEQIGVHRSTLSRLVRQKMRRKPHEYLTCVRMDLGQNMLLGTDLSVKEIAERCGIQNVSLFDKLFRMTNGMTPSQFRQKRQKAD